MSTLLRTIEFLGLSLWLGSDVFLSFVVAPGAFRILASRDQGTFESLATPVALCVVLMILLTVVSQHAVSPKMAVLRVQIGSIQAMAADSPLLTEFGRLHRISASLEGGVMLAGLVSLYLMVKDLGVGN